MDTKDSYIETDKIHTCKNGSQFPVVIYEGKECYKLANGVLKDPTTGHMVTSKFSQTKITKENARQMQANRYKETQQAIRDGLAKKFAEENKISFNDLSLSERKRSTLGAIQEMSGNLYHLAATGDKLQSVKAFETLLKTGDLIPTSSKSGAPGANIAINNLTIQQINAVQDDLEALADPE